MSTIVTRAGKGSALTHNEVDANFVNLNNDKLEAATTTTLSNKTIALGSNTVSGTLAQFNTAMTDADFATGGGTATGTNTGDQTSIVGITGTTAQFNTALTDGDFATLAGTETLTNKTLTSPTITGGAFNGSLGATTPSTVAATDLTTTGNTILGNASTDTLNVGNGDLVKDASGNVGVGVTPSAWSLGNAIELESAGNALWASGANDIRIVSNIYYNSGYKYAATGAAAQYIQGTGTHNWYIAPSGTAGGAITFTSGMTLDASGNLGLGVTPSAWRSTTKAIEQPAGFLYSFSTAAIGIGNNAYLDAVGWKYKATAAASNYEQTSGTHLWSVAPSGTAGNAITFTQAMTLDASGNLLVGASSVLSGVSNYKTLQVTGTTGGIVDIGSNSTVYGRCSADSAGMNVEATVAGTPVFFRTGGSERMRITSGGEVYVAGTTDRGAFNLQCNGTGVWGAGAYTNGSDKRIKNNIEPLATGLDVVAKLNPVTYKYNEDWSKDQSIQTGFIAQELLTALDGKNYVDGIVNQSSEYMSVAYQNIIPILTKAIQEQQALITSLTARLDAAGIA